MFRQWYAEPPDFGISQEDDEVLLQNGLHLYLMLPADPDRAERQLYHAWVEVQKKRALRAARTARETEPSGGNVVPLKSA